MWTLPSLQRQLDLGAAVRLLGCQVPPTPGLVSVFCSCKLNLANKKMKKGRCKDVFMAQLQTFSDYFLVCGGVQTDPCISFLQNGTEPKCSYLGVPPSGNNRKVYPRFCQSLHEKALSNIRYDKRTSYFSFTHASWSNAVNFIVLVPNFLVFGKITVFYV